MLRYQDESILMHWDFNWRGSRSFDGELEVLKAYGGFRFSQSQVGGRDAEIVSYMAENEFPEAEDRRHVLYIKFPKSTNDFVTLMMFYRRDEDAAVVDQILGSLHFKTREERIIPEQISWEKVVHLIKSGAIVEVTHLSSQRVLLTTSNLNAYSSREPGSGILRSLLESAPNRREIIQGWACR